MSARADIARFLSLPYYNHNFGVSSAYPTLMILAVLNQKGGVGKTTTTINLGAALSELDQRVLLADLDVTQQSLSRQVGNVEGVEAITLSATQVNELASARADSFDYALLDCPPTLGEEIAAALKVADVALVPLPPELPAVEGLALLLKTIERAKAVNPKLETRLLITLADPRDPTAAALEAQLRKRFGHQVLPQTIKRSPVFSRAVMSQSDVLSASPTSHGAAAYRAAAQEIMALGKKLKKSSARADDKGSSKAKPSKSKTASKAKK